MPPLANDSLSTESEDKLRVKAIELTNNLPGNFDIRLTNAIIEDRGYDIQGLTEALTTSPHRDFSMLFYGFSGTGKSALARYIATELGMEVEFKRASDLLDKYVGETEKGIARMFEEAEHRGTFIIVDEADSFLRDRRSAERSWEVTQVNEMLTWLENHPYPVAFTTNLVDDLDEASKRRFTFKIRFDFLEPEQAIHAYNVFFGREAPQGLDGITNLAPGDFLTVSKQIKFVNPNPSDAELLAALRQESELKEGLSRKPGFDLTPFKQRVS